MSKPHFGVGLVHGVVATAGAPPPQGADAFDAALVIRVAAKAHALMISNVPHHLRRDLEADALFSDAARVSILAVGHHRILQAAAEVTDVVPIRLGTVVSGPAGARDLLKREAQRFADRLAAIHHAVEFAVRILRVQGRTCPVSPTHAGSGRDYLRARRDERTNGRPAIVGIAFQELARRAVAICERTPNVRQPGRPPSVADAAFLVDRRNRAAFAACAERIERQIAADGLALDVFGPLPAYSFVDAPAEDLR